MPGVATVERLDVDAMHDFNVTMTDGRYLRVECKNASPKTRRVGRSRSRCRRPAPPGATPPPASTQPTAWMSSLHVVLAHRPGEFRYGPTSRMAGRKDFTDRLAPIQTITDDWPRPR